MKASRELDAKIWVEIFKGEVVPNVECMYECGFATTYGIAGTGRRDGLGDFPYDPVLDFSTYIADAWTVVEKLCEMGFNPTVQFNRINRPVEQQWFVSFMNIPGTAHSETAPHAICLAALEVVK